MFTKPARRQALRRPHTAAIAAALTAIALAQTATPAAAADRFWTCPPNYFTNPVCWSNPGPVLSSDNLLIRPNGPIPVDVTFPGTSAINPYQAVQSLSLNGALNSAAPTLNVRSGTLSIGTFNVGIDYPAVVGQTGGEVYGRSTVINGSYTLSGGRLAVAASLTNSGVLLVQGSGRLGVEQLYNTGLILVRGANATAETVTTENRGRIELTDATWISPRGNAYNEVGGVISGSNSSFGFLLENKGLIQATAGTFALPTPEFAPRNHGEIRVANAATLSVPRGVVNEAGGVISLNGVDAGNGPQAILSNGNSGTTLSNSGTLQGAGFVAMPVNHQGKVTARAGGTLTFSRSFASAAGSAMAAEGTLRFNGPASIHNGALISGAGATWFNSTLSVGAAGAAGLMKVTGNVLVGSTYFADILGTLAGVGYDQLAVGGQLALASSSVLKLGSGSFVAQAGQSFKLFDWGNLSGEFGVVDTSALQLASGATLDMSRLYVDGTLAIVAVPEPATWALTIAGIAGLLARRRMGRQAQGQA